MGRHRFRLSNMIPNAWFYKLKDMGNGGAKNGLKGATKPTKKTATTPKPPFPRPPQSPVKRRTAINPGRASYYIPRPDEGSPDFPFHPKALDTKFLADPPRKSNKKTRGRAPSPKLVRSSVSSHCSCRGATLGSYWKEEPFPPEYPPPPASPTLLDDDDFDGLPCSDKPVIAENSHAHSRSSSSCSSRVTSSSPPDNASSKSSAADVDLPPILTKPARKDAEFCGQLEATGSPMKQQRSPRPRRRSYDVGGVRVRANSPRLASCRKAQGRKYRNVSGSVAVTPGKGRLSGSFAVVKASSDPRKDFRESMLEMIVENGIRASKDLEDLLACYLSLNSADYHDVIVQVFQQIWFDLTTTPLPISDSKPPPFN